MIPKVQATNVKTYKLDYVKIKNLCTLKDTTVKGDLQNERKYLQIVFDKRLYLEHIRIPITQQIKQRT